MVMFVSAYKPEHFRDKKLLLIVNHSYPRHTRHSGYILNASESNITILNEHHDTLGDEPYAIVYYDSQNTDRSTKTAIELLGESYQNEGPTHESEFENSRPITENCPSNSDHLTGLQGSAHRIDVDRELLHQSWSFSLSPTADHDLSNSSPSVRTEDLAALATPYPVAGRLSLSGRRKSRYFDCNNI